MSLLDHYTLDKTFLPEYNLSQKHNPTKHY